MNDHPPPDALAEFARGRLPPQRALEVALHLPACDACRAAFGALAADGAKDPPTVDGLLPPPNPSTLDAPGVPAHLRKVLEPFGYEVERRIGGGGMGEVYLADQVLVGRKVAVKVMRADVMHHPEAVGRFQREARSMAKLDHPNTVRMFDAQLSGSTHFLVMEYVPGQSLDRLIGRGGLPVGRACEYTQQAALGLHHAASHHMVHRDVKPSNLLLTDGGRVKVSDFGLVRITRDDAQVSSLTQSGGLVGTLDYIAPEQIRGEKEVDIRADVYALGCTLYHLIAGHPPFPGGAGYQKIARHLNDTPAPLSAVRAGVPPDLAAVVGKMMAREPGDRYQTPVDVVRALAPFGRAVKGGGGGGGGGGGVKSQPAFVPIPAGDAVLGAKAEVVARLTDTYGLSGKRLEQIASPPPRFARLPAFDIARAAATNDEYRAFVAATGWRAPGHWTEKANSPMAEGDRPVVRVAFADAEAFCQWKGVRLPTNDEWERAARGTDGRAYPWGDVWKAGRGEDGWGAHTLERYKATGVELVPAGGLPASASPDGPLNMAGNVWEWVDGGEGDRKHTRGGSWEYQGDVYALAWFRMPTDPDIAVDDVGFRYARDSAPPPPDLSADELAATVRVRGGSYKVGVSAAELGPLAHALDLSEADARTLGRNAARRVTVGDLAVRRACVTNEEYLAFTKETGYPWPKHWSRELLAWSGRPFLAKYRFHPVTCVDLRDATAYCGWRGVRLPTGDEWEVAARGEAGFHYPWGNQFDSAKCNARESGRGRTTRVDEHPAGTSPTGCWDMGGNVQEWVASDGGGQPTVRGGSFAATGNLHALTFLYIHADADVARPYIGFRYVLRDRGGAA